jgi:hypothetical protein
MRVLETRVEEVDPDLFWLNMLITIAKPKKAKTGDGLGEGPTGDAVIDHIVQRLIENLSDISLKASRIIQLTGDHPSTVYRQLRVLASDDFIAECPRRLRGWVQDFGQGRYGLTDAARRRLEKGA